MDEHFDVMQEHTEAKERLLKQYCKATVHTPHT